MSKKSISRQDAEAKEGLDQVVNAVPENRMQDKQQIATVDSASKTTGPDSSFSAKKTKAAGSQLKQEKISDVLTGAPGDSGMGITMGGRGVSGTAGGILGANNSTPIAGQSRSESRPGKKLDRIATKLNYTPCERNIVEFDESKPLAESADSDQGYNGTYRNEDARSQKIMGAVPGDLMFQRSVDLITKDKAYFLEGQMNFQAGDDRKAIYPSKSYNISTKKYESYNLELGNYLHRAMHVGLNSAGKVTYMYFDVDDITATGLSPEEVNVASAHKLIKQNTAELDRMAMDAKAGDEKADLWTPMARATLEPTKQAALMATVEAETGGYVHLAYSKATTNFSYFLNRAAKDGLEVKKPFVEECCGALSTYTTGSSFSDDPQSVFSTAEYSAGNPSLMIAAYDSVGKYNNKSDLLLQPRGWRMHLQTADNNMDPLKVPAEYATVYAGQETFSTIDHEYDGLLPICMTDKATIIDSINLNQMAAYYVGDTDFTVTWTGTGIDDADYTYDEKYLVPSSYGIGYYVYVKQSADTFAGLLAYNNDNKIKFKDDSENGERTYTFHLSTYKLADEELASGGKYEGYTLFNSNAIIGGIDLLVPKVQDASGTTITAVSFNKVHGDHRVYVSDGGPYTYKYTDIRNEYVVTVYHPLCEGIVQYLEQSIGAKFYSLLNGNELYVPLIFSTQYMTLAPLIICAATPWITRVRANSMKDVIYYEDNIHEYPYSKLISLRNSPFKNYVNFGFGGYDEPLQCKVMQPVNAVQWVMPEFFWKASDGTNIAYVCPWYFNEEEIRTSDSSAMSFPSIRSGVRLGSLDLLYGMSEKDIRLSLDRMTKSLFTANSEYWAATGVYKYGMTTDGQPIIQYVNGTMDGIPLSLILTCPRELGLCFDMPLGVLTKDPADSGSYKALDASGISTSFVIKVWTNPNTSEHPTILNNNGVNISRAANYSQKWFAIYANESADNSDIAGLVFGLNDEGAATFTPFIGLDGNATTITAPTIRSLQRSLWTRLQLLPFVISPFDAVGSTNNLKIDIYDLGYMFGLAGFRASDYRESVYNREKEVVNQGFLFVSDPWVLESPIIKHGSSSTGIVNAKGFAIRHE